VSHELSEAQVEYAGAVSEANIIAEETFGTGGGAARRVERSIATARQLFKRAS
jgi:hypothetical protein